MADSIKGARADYVLMDEITHYTLRTPDGDITLDEFDARKLSDSISTAIHESVEDEPLAAPPTAFPHDDIAAATKRAVDTFAAEMRERSAESVRAVHGPRGYFSTGATTSRFATGATTSSSFSATGKFYPDYYALFDADGRITAWIDPADTEFIDTIPPLENL